MRVRYPDWHLAWMRRWVGPDFGYPVHRHVRLDVGIAPLVKALWARRIPTFASCQGAGDWGAHVFYAPSVDPRGYPATYDDLVRQAAAEAGVHAVVDFDAVCLDPHDVTALAAALRRNGAVARVRRVAPRPSGRSRRLHGALDRLGAL